MSIAQQNAVCPAILIGLNEIMKDGAPDQLFTQVGLTQALLDPTNRQPNTVVQNVDAGNGHPKTVRIKHRQRSTTADTTTAKDCAPGTPKPYFEETFTVNQYRQHTINVKESTIRTLCDAASQLVKVPGAEFNTWEGNAYNLQLMSELVAEMLMDMDAIRLAINSDLQTSAVLGIGGYVGTAAQAGKKFNMYGTSNTTGLQEGRPVLSGFNEFKREMARTTMTGQPIVVGEGYLDLALAALSYGCCNNSGNDFGKMNGNTGFKYYKDFTMGAALGGGGVDTEWLAFMPGAMQLATYNEYVGAFARPIGIVERGTIPDPALPGIKYDMRIIPNACSGNNVVESYDVIIGLHFDLYQAPINMFKAGDRLVNVNGIFHGQTGLL